MSGQQGHPKDLEWVSLVRICEGWRAHLPSCGSTGLEVAVYGFDIYQISTVEPVNSLSLNMDMHSMVELLLCVPSLNVSYPGACFTTLTMTSR